jgi:hypothetical protein
LLAVSEPLSLVSLLWVSEADWDADAEPPELLLSVAVPDAGVVSIPESARLSPSDEQATSATEAIQAKRFISNPLRVHLDAPPGLTSSARVGFCPDWLYVNRNAKWSAL